MTSLETIKSLVEQTKERCLNWIEETKEGVFFVDPLDKKEISAHYGATHAAVSFLLLGLKNKDKKLEDVSVKLFSSIVERWSLISKLPEFHNDFNNFALCVAIEYLKDILEYKSLFEKLKNIVISTLDSPHNTVNWIPMRWYVNKCRYEWTGEEKYVTKCRECYAKIKAATYDDGFIDDRLPKGKSFNLQYDVATVAVMQFIRNRGEKLDISREAGALINAVAPDGDINYLGRGTNQVFAWGLWIYFLASAGLDDVLEKALAYCIDKIPIMLKNNNLMLNEWDGAEKYLWWDYHYCSVYTAHFLFWLVLAIEDYHVNEVLPVLSNAKDSGVEIIRDNGWFVAFFSGRSEYLAERGPIISAIGLGTGQMFVKGSFGPWQGAFGNKYISPMAVMNNFFGLKRIAMFPQNIRNRVVKKICSFFKKKVVQTEFPFFERGAVKCEENRIKIVFQNTQNKASLINIPLISSQLCRLTLDVDGNSGKMWNVGSLKNQYGKCEIYQSKVYAAKVWTLILEIVGENEDK